MSTVATIKQRALEAASFGQRIAEDEVHELAEYFVETDQWRRLYSGAADIVYGPKAQVRARCIRCSSRTRTSSSTAGFCS